MKKLIATVLVSTTLSGCGTSLTYDNGDINWKAVAVTSTLAITGALLCKEFCSIQHDHDVNVHSGEQSININTEVDTSKITPEEIERLRKLKEETNG